MKPKLGSAGATKPGFYGVDHLALPGVDARADLTHAHPFGLCSFFYCCDPANQPKRKGPSFYVDFRVRVERIEIRFYKHSLLDKLVVPWLAKLVNSSVRLQDWYERRLCRLWHLSELEFVLRPVKT